MGALENKGLQQKNQMPILEKATFKIVGNSMVFLPALPSFLPEHSTGQRGRSTSSQLPVPSLEHRGSGATL